MTANRNQKQRVRARALKTGESYTAARRQVITEFQVSGGNEPAGEPERFAISYDDMGPISTWADTLLGGGPTGGRIEVDAGELRLRMADFKVDVPRASVRRAATFGTAGCRSDIGERPPEPFSERLHAEL